MVTLAKSLAADAAGSQSEQQQQRNQERENAKRFGDGEAENQVAELPLRSRRIAQRRRKVVAENDANADAAHADTGDTSPDIFRGGRIHENSSLIGGLR
jgi:hypothetical protein